MDGIHIDDDVEFLLLALNILAEGTLPQVDQELGEDVVEPFPGDEAVLKMEVEDAVYGAGDEDRNDCFFCLVRLPKAAAHLVDVDQGFLPEEERLHDFGVGFPDAFELGLGHDGGMGHVLVAVPHLPEVPGDDRPRDLHVVVRLNEVGHLHRRVELLILQDLFDDLLYRDRLPILPLLLQGRDQRPCLHDLIGPILPELMEDRRVS